LKDEKACGTFLHNSATTLFAQWDVLPMCVSSETVIFKK